MDITQGELTNLTLKYY